ncbi:hypothetical protein N5J43_24225 [Pseudomonas nicosulfuronedens]|uniref:hypothetical protein n=1 Tax=Pseudomonas nicosulfuronedens TaxID=2571105 RepID=UPI00244A8822|nr:hypothetical protein [Pseudomonas nicosulfuronedens]MDH1007226.1 hypothetical protein [Pseudomonas nicosulfuronedens]MDH1982071.1 hypothetical protein [Pseudomonas nicosulfuronedens]MDH2026321.1 hypothetical protein [Pseudomonas nicosulfuronedens]
MQSNIAKEIRISTAILLSTLCIAIYIAQEQIIPEYFFIDSQTINDLLKYHDLSNYPKNSFSTTAYIYDILGQTLSQVIILLAALSTIVFICLNSRSSSFLTVAVLFTIPFCIFNLKYSKENFVILMNLTICLLLRHKKPGNTIKLIIIATTYITYSYYFRPYFAFISILLPAIYIIANTPNKRPIIITIIIIICFAIPAELWNQLQQSRDMVNEGREGLSNSKTAFTNLLEPNGFLSAIPNSLYGLVRFYFSPIFSFRAQEIVLSSVLWGVTALAFTKCNCKSPIFCLIASNLILQTFFEPDLGSFFRHMMAYIFCLYATTR